MRRWLAGVRAFGSLVCDGGVVRMTEIKGPLLWVAWTLVLVLNLVVPLPLGLSYTGEGGRLGIGLGVFAWWVVGLAICVRRPNLGRLLLTGGKAIGISQLVPVAQVAAGFGALGL